VQPLVPQGVAAGRKTSMHAGVPLHVRVTQLFELQVTAVPTQPDAPQVSPQLQASPSSHEFVVRHCQTPPTRVHQ
jgi:hypothetical protein